MVTRTIPWNSGGSNIKITYMGSGNNSLSIESDTENDSFYERSQVITLETNNGSPIQVKSLTVHQAAKTIPVGTVFNFAYTGTVQEVTLPPGKYKLQCWGAQGGNSGSYSGVGSKGGYSEGVLTLTEVTTLCIFVEGKGASSGNGGWNGGSGSTGSSSYNSGNTYGKSYPACGGGAMDIATVTSDMAYSDKRNNRSAASLLSRCIVAGGGAGASARYTEVTTTTGGYAFVDLTGEHNGKYIAAGGNLSDNSSYIATDYVSVSQLRGKTISFVNQINDYEVQARTFAFYNASYNFVGQLYNNQSSVVVSDSAAYIRLTLYKSSVSSMLSNTLQPAIRYETEPVTSTDTSSSKSNSYQQGGGTETGHSGNGYARITVL